jgi:adenosine/AMP kinase
MNIEAVKIEVPEGCNVILGQTHFIKSVEDIYEIVATSQPGCRFGLAFCEASGPCLIRIEGNDQELKKVAAGMAQKVASGHFFVLVLQGAFPISVLNGIKACQEVCSLFCATANPLQVIVAETDQGRGVLGVVDGFPPRGLEGEEDVAQRKEFLRRIGYKRG